jgi:hypothetical protein
VSRDFWISSGHHLTERSEGGGLVATDGFLKLWLARPEMMPPPEACAAERVLHARLLAEPRLPVEPDWIAGLADPDARENWTVFLAFRDRLLAHPTLEAVYLDLARRGTGGTPPMFMEQLVHVILRGILDGETDAHVLRAGELLFRPQRLAVHEGRLLLADAERVEDRRPAAHGSPLTALFEDAGARSLDVLGPETAESYADRSDAFDLALDFRLDGPGRAAFARVLERWIAHMLALETRIEPVPAVEGDLAWFVGLDAEATRLGNAVWTGVELAPEDAARIVALFRLEIRDTARVVDWVAGRPVTLILAADRERLVRVKPQNLLVGLPLREADG